MRDVLRCFDRLLLQDEPSRARFEVLGAVATDISVVGALKAAARPLPADTGEVAQLKAAIGARPVWFAAATHPVEETGVISAHARVREYFEDAMLIVAPRYMESAEGLERAAQDRFETVHRRGRGEALGPTTDVYIADTLGDMGRWYRLSPMSFVGHSISAAGGEGGGGKNPYEAIALGSVVIHGPDVQDFSETYDDLNSAGATRQVASMDELSTAVVALMRGHGADECRAAAQKVIAARRGVLDTTWAEIGRAIAREFAVSIQIVTGPSFTSETAMSAPNCPVSTAISQSRKA